MAESRCEEMRQAAGRFHAAHPNVWRLFERFALEKLELGYAHYGAKAIMERVRWETDAGAKSPQLKISNNHTTFYARRFMRLHPRHAGFFHTHAQKSAHRRATGRPEPLRPL